MLSNKQQNKIINLQGAALGQAARSALEQPAYPPVIFSKDDIFSMNIL
jgi:hypothetical protein